MANGTADRFGMTLSVTYGVAVVVAVVICRDVPVGAGVLQGVALATTKALYASWLFPSVRHL